MTDADGPENYLTYLVGETINGAFQDQEGKIWLVLESGSAIVFGSRGGGSPVYRRELPASVQIFIAERRAEIERQIAELSAELRDTADCGQRVT